MRINWVKPFISGWNNNRNIEPGLQGKLYVWLNQASQQNPYLGRVCAIPVTIADVALEAIKTPLEAIELMASAILNLVGAFFYALGRTDGHFYQDRYPFRDCLPKDTLHQAKWCLNSLYVLPLVPLVSAVQFVYQLGAALKDPVNIQSITAYPYLTTFK